MASTIKIKRSGVAGNPATLAAGELAYSSLTNNDSNGGDRLYIGVGAETAGNASAHVVIGGKYFTDMMDHQRGVLTADSAIITDQYGKINDLKVDNLEINGSDITSLDTNGNINITPNGTGVTNIKNLVATNVVNSSLTDGRVVFAGTDGVLSDSQYFVWDNVNNQLSIAGAFKTDNVKVDGNVISTVNDDGTLIIRPIQTNSDASASQAVVKIDNIRGLIIPVGSTSDRPAVPDTGLIRFNTTNNQYEGYNGSQYISIGGVRSVDGLTYITAETVPGVSDDILTFVVNNVTQMTLDTDSLDVSATVTNTNFAATTASTTTSTGAVTVVGGVGIGGQINVGGATNKFTASTASTNTTSGAVVVTGGVGVGGNLNVGGDANITGTFTVASSGAPTAVSIEASTLTLESSQNASIGVDANSSSSYTLTLRAENSSSGDANMDVNVKNSYTLDATSISIDATDSSNFSITTNSASNKTLTLDATNAGAGLGIIAVGSSSTDQVNLASDTVNGQINLTSNGVNVTATAYNATVDTYSVSTSGSTDRVALTTATLRTYADTVNIIGKNGSADATVNVTGILNVDNIRIDGNTIFTTDVSNTLYLDPAPMNDNGGTVVIKGNLQVDGTTTTINSTQVTIDDPIFVLSGDTTPSSDDNLDRGIEFKWFNGTAKLGFFGYDDSAAEFVFIPDATDTNSVITGTLGNVAFGNMRLDAATESTTTTTGTLKVDGGVGITGQLNVGGTTNKFTATTDTSSVTTGALIIAGGVGIGKSLFIGDNITGSGTYGSGGDPMSVIDNFVMDGGTY